MSPSSAVLVAVTTFVATNVDGFVVLTSLFSMRPPLGTLSSRQIVLGQYGGFVALVALSLLAAVGLRIVPERHIHWLGLVPLAVGIRGFSRRGESGGGQEALTISSTAGVAGITFANGADNISLYIPLFRHSGSAATALMVTVFLLLLAVLCLAGAALSRQRHVQAVLERYRYVLVPFVFIAIGVSILTDLL